MNTPSNTLPIQVTEAAKQEILKVFQTKNIPQGYGLRVGMQGAGCSGLSYQLGFDKSTPADDVYDLEGVPVYIERKHTMYVLGLTIDFEDGVQARGFVLSNPALQS